MMKSISCPLCCNSTFASHQDLKNHLLKVTKNLRCPECCVLCSNISTLIEHLDSCFNQHKNDINQHKNDINDSRKNIVNQKSKVSTRSSSKIKQEAVESINESNCKYGLPSNSTQLNGEIKNEVTSLNVGTNTSSLNGVDDTKLTENSDVEDDSKEDDVEGFYCTVCNLKIPSIEEHIQQFHNGQEVILQDDEDEEEEEDEISSDNLESSSPISKNKSLSNGHGNYTDASIKTGNYKVSNIKSNTNKLPVQKPTGNVVGDKKLIKKPVKSRVVIPSVNTRNSITQDYVDKELNDDQMKEKFYCTHCDVSFLSIEKHMNSFHQNQDIVLQDIEETLVLPRSTNGRAHLDKFPYKCPECKSCFATKLYLTEHLQSHSNIEGTPPLILDKGKPFVKRPPVKRTRTSDISENHFKPKKSYTFNNSAFPENSKAENGKDANPFFDTNGQFPRYLCDICGKQLSRSGLEIHLRNHGMDLFTCKLCKAEFPYFNDYIRHRKSHDNKPQFSCNLCGKVYEFSSTLKIHLKSHQ